MRSNGSSAAATAHGQGRSDDSRGAVTQRGELCYRAHGAPLTEMDGWMDGFRGCRERGRCAFVPQVLPVQCLPLAQSLDGMVWGYNLTLQFCSWLVSVLFTSESDLLNARGLGMHGYSCGELRKYSQGYMASGNIRHCVLVQLEVDASTFASTETGAGVLGSQEFWEAAPCEILVAENPLGMSCGYIPSSSVPLIAWRKVRSRRVLLSPQKHNFAEKFSQRVLLTLLRRKRNHPLLLWFMFCHIG